MQFEKRQICTVEVELLLFDGSLSTCYEKNYGCVNIKIPKTRNSTNPDAQTFLWNARDSLSWHTNQNRFSNCRPTSCSRKARASSCRTRTQKVPPPTPTATTLQRKKDRGVHSVLRSGVEQRSFVHNVSPLGALPSPLSDVERKTKCTQTTRTIRAQSHWDRF